MKVSKALVLPTFPVTRMQLCSNSCLDVLLIFERVTLGVKRAVCLLEVRLRSLFALGFTRR